MKSHHRNSSPLRPLCLVLMLTLCVATACHQHHSPEATVTTFLNALQQGDYDAAFSCTTAPESIRSATVDSYRSFELKVVDYKILSTSLDPDGQHATVNVRTTQTTTFSSVPGESVDTYPLVLVDNQWKIDL